MDINADAHKSQEKTSDVFDSYSSLCGWDKQQQQQNKNTFHTCYQIIVHVPCNLLCKTN